MAERNKRISLKRLEEDRNGLVNYIAQLRGSIAELKHRAILAEGALQYLNNLLKNEEAKNDSL